MGFRVFLGSHDRVCSEYKEEHQESGSEAQAGVVKRRPSEFSDGWVIPISNGDKVVLY